MLQLLSLPGEILAAIVAPLGPSQIDFDEFDHYYLPDVSLCSLARTCTTLRDICIPKVYEICSIKTPYGSVRRSLRTLRMLATRPEIASQVKRVIVDAAFNFDIRNGDEVVLSAEDATLYNRILEEKFDMCGVAPLHELRATDAIESQEWEAVGQSLACLAFALVPNVTSAIFLSHYTSLGCTMTGSLPFLEAFSLQHADTELGTNFGLVNGVLLAAPNVRRLIGWSISSLSTAEYPSVKEVVLGYSRIGDEQMARLPVVFPNLERFTYMDGGPLVNDEIPASPLVVSEALLRLRKTLKHVELGAPYQNMADCLYDIDGTDRYMESLALMEVLESLRLHALYIFNDDDDPDEPSSTTELVHFLPRSIQRLYMEGVRSSKLNDILALAQSAPHTFPRLTHVNFPWLDKPLAEVVRNAYEGSGIKCSFEDVAVNEYACGCA